MFGPTRSLVFHLGFNPNHILFASTRAQPSFMVAYRGFTSNKDGYCISEKDRQRLQYAPPKDFRFFNPETLPGAEEHHEEMDAKGSDGKTYEWPSYNKRIYKPDGTYRPAFVCHMRANIKYSPEKMWYVAVLMRGKSVDEALKQLQFQQLKGARVAEEVLKEARDLALEEHSFEYATNMWVAEALTDQSQIIKGYRRHARFRLGTVKYRYTNLYLRLEEGRPPKHYLENVAPQSPREQIERFLKEHREKRLVVD